MLLSALLCAKDIRTVTFSTHLHCENCAKKVMENVSFTKGVKDMTVSLKDQRIVIVYDADKVSAEKLQAEIKKLGYPAVVVPEEEVKK